MKIILLSLFGIVWLISFIEGLRLVYKLYKSKSLFNHPADCETYCIQIAMLTKNAIITVENGIYYIEFAPSSILYPDYKIKLPIYNPSSISVDKWKIYRFKHNGGNGGCGYIAYYNTINLKNIATPNPIIYYTDQNDLDEEMDINQIDIADERLTFDLYIHFIQNGIPIPFTLNDGLICIVSDTNTNMDIPDHNYYLYTYADSKINSSIQYRTIHSSIRYGIEEFIMLNADMGFSNVLDIMHDMMKSKQPHRYVFTTFGKKFYLR